MSKTVKLPAAYLLRLIEGIKNFASKDAYMPQINSIHFEAYQGHLWLEATDRVVAGGVKGPVTKAEFDVTIPLDDVKRLSQILRWFRKDGEVSLADRGTECVVTVASPSNGIKTLNLRFETIKSFPPIKKLGKPDADAQPPETTPATYDTQKLKVLADIAEHGVFATREAKPGLFVAKDAWALIMPVRYDAENGGKGDWNHLVKELNNG